MQSNTITLSVDAANDGNPADAVFTRHEETTNRATYVGPNHALDAKETMQFYRTFPKKNSITRGAAKSAIKFTTDLEVDNADGSGQVVLPLIAEVSFSVPVGATEAQMTEIRQRLVSILDDDTVMDDLMGTLEI